MLHKIYQSCEELDYAKQHSPQIPQSSKQHSPGFQTQAYVFSPSPNYQQHSSSRKIAKAGGNQRKLQTQQQPKTLDQTSNYGQSSSSLGSFHDLNSSKHSPSQSMKSPDADNNTNIIGVKKDSGPLVLQTFRNENPLRKKQQHHQQPKQQSIFGTASRKYFTTERSHSMLDASHFQVKKHQHFFRQQQSIANELKEKQKLKQQQHHDTKQDFLLPMYQVKEKDRSRELLSDELSEEDDTPSSGLSG